MSTIAIIPARGGSKRIPQKNIKEFCGKPIIAYSIEAALESGIFDEVMVSTDDEEIADISRKYGANVPFYRSKDTSTDAVMLASVFQEVLLEYEKLGESFDYFACLLPTAPFITPEKLRKMMYTIKEQAADMIDSVARYCVPPQQAMAIRNGSLFPLDVVALNCPSQSLEPLYFGAGQFSAFDTEVFLHRKNKSGKWLPIIVPEEEVQDIDNESDWKLAEIKYRRFILHEE